MKQREQELLSAQEEAQQKAKNLVDHFAHPEANEQKKAIYNLDSFEMIERATLGYLSGKECKSKSVFSSFGQKMFPGGIVTGRRDKGIVPGRDLFTALKMAAEQKNADPRLKEPEITLTKILGYDLTYSLLEWRQKFLEELVKEDKGWEPNLETNRLAMNNLTAKETQLKNPISVQEAKLSKLSRFAKQPSDSEIKEIIPHELVQLISKIDEYTKNGKIRQENSSMSDYDKHLIDDCTEKAALLKKFAEENDVDLLSRLSNSLQDHSHEYYQRESAFIDLLKETSNTCEKLQEGKSYQNRG